MSYVSLYSALALIVFTGSASAAGSDRASQSEDTPQTAVAVLAPTEGNEAHGMVRFMSSGDGLAYQIQAHDLKPGVHGIHIHLYGDCSGADGKTAGTHFNLRGSSLHPPKQIDRITGNLGNLDADADGNASAKGTLAHASLTGAKSIVGRGVIIHAKANDPSQPPIGAAGSRQACGAIGIAEPSES